MFGLEIQHLNDYSRHRTCRNNSTSRWRQKHIRHAHEEEIGDLCGVTLCGNIKPFVAAGGAEESLKLLLVQTFNCPI